MTKHTDHTKNQYWRAAERCYCPNSLCKKTMVAFKAYKDSNNGEKKSISIYMDNKSGRFELTITSQERDSSVPRLSHGSISSVFSGAKSIHELLQNIATPVNKLKCHLCSSLNLIYLPLQIRYRKIKQILRKSKQSNAWTAVQITTKCSSDFKDMTEEGYDGLQYHKQHQESKKEDALELGSII